MSSRAEPLPNPSQLDAEDQAWLEARLIEYQELLAYLRDH